MSAAADAEAQAPIPAVEPRAVGERMFADDQASRGLGMRLESIAEGRAVLSMTVQERMLNGFRICHGGFITTLADSAFACACNSRNVLTVAAGLTVDFLAPAHAGDVLTATAVEMSRRGRTGLYDVAVTKGDGTTVALVRGRSHALGRPVVSAEEPA